MIMLPQTYSLRMNRVTKSRDMNKGSFLGHPLGSRGASSIPTRDSFRALYS